MKTSQELTFNDLSREEGLLTTVDVNTLRPMPVDYQTFPWKGITDEQKKQVEDMKNKLQNARDNAQKQQESEQKKSERKQEFSSEIDELENDDLQISSASNAEDELAMTASSFEQWDELLSEMYDYLSGVLNADQYASEEANYKQWVAERDSGAENAASETDDSTQKQLASYSFKQSYTKARCYKLLDMM